MGRSLPPLPINCRTEHYGHHNQPQSRGRALITRRACMNRASDRRRGLPVFMPIRYADDFVILVASYDNDPEKSRLLAEQEKSALAEMLKAHMGLTLSPEKTLVTPVTSTIRFLGHHLRVRRQPRLGGP